MRVKQIKKSMKPFRCSKCGKEIPAGSSYRYWQHMRMPITRWCMDCGAPKESDLASSDKVQRYCKVREDIEKAASDAQGASVDDVMDLIQELVSAMDTGVEELRALSEEYNTSADNMETVFPNGSSVIDDVRQTADTCETWADNLDNARQELEGITLEDYQCDCDDEHEVDCDECGGEGDNEYDGTEGDSIYPRETVMIECETCNGTGRVGCDVCDGTGVKLDDMLQAIQDAVDEGMSETL
jgi:hypothetical protein